VEEEQQAEPAPPARAKLRLDAGKRPQSAAEKAAERARVKPRVPAHVARQQQEAAAVRIQAHARGYLARVAHPGLVPASTRRRQQVEVEYEDDFVVEDDDDGEAEWEASLQVSVGQQVSELWV
jgi:uncharacterized membrane protein